MVLQPIYYCQKILQRVAKANGLRDPKDPTSNLIAAGEIASDRGVAQVHDALTTATCAEHPMYFA